jgi:hypothetical protein
MGTPWVFLFLEESGGPMLVCSMDIGPKGVEYSWHATYRM